jgi:hypothetical protein
MSFYYNNWCTYKNSNVDINEYKSYKTPSSLSDALKIQAKLIDDTNSDYVVFLSGGIDSQTKALGFILAGIDVKFVTLKHTYNGKSNDLEIFYAQQFCNKHNVELTMFEINYSKLDIQDIILERDLLSTAVGTGAVFQFDGYRKYIEQTGSKIVTSYTPFTFKRVEQTCHGYMCKPDGNVLRYLNPDNIIVFDIYAPYLYRYYEHVHRNTLEIQILKQYEAKNLAYNELELPFRPKLSGWEFLCDKDYSTLNTIDWSDDHSKLARLANGAPTILKALELPESLANSRPKYVKGECYVELYSFETAHQFPY